MAKRCPRIAQIAVKNILRSRKLTTKSNYFSCLRSCFAFMIESGLDPMNKNHYKPEVITYWIIDQADRLGNCSAWSTWISSMTWWLGAIGGSTAFLVSDFYKQQRKAIKTLYKKQRQTRLPFQIRFLLDWFRKKGISRKTWDKISIDLLEEALCYVTLLFSISRPGEVLWSDNTEFPEWEILTTGLRWGDIKYCNQMAEYCKQWITITIEHYKNKVYNDMPKIIPMGPPICKNRNCTCHDLDFIQMLGVLKRRRNKLVNKLKLKLKNFKGGSKRKLINRIKNLATSPDNYVFVGGNGVVWRTRHLSDKMKKMVKLIALTPAKAYTNYSWRVCNMFSTYSDIFFCLLVIRLEQ